MKKRIIALLMCIITNTSFVMSADNTDGLVKPASPLAIPKAQGSAKLTADEKLPALDLKGNPSQTMPAINNTKTGTFRNSNNQNNLQPKALPDWGPYMRQLQRKIKMNWAPPKGTESKQVVLQLKISNNGSLLSKTVLKSSGSQAADNAAIKAVELSQPFGKFPVEYKKTDVDIQFTFDYNVFGSSIK